jgi:hypothetical protein
MNPYLAASSLPVQVPPIQPPPIPPRRLFQIPDASGSPTPGNLNLTNSALANLAPPGVVTLPSGVNYMPKGVASPGSNASVFGDGNVNNQVLNYDQSGQMFNSYFDLTAMSVPNSPIPGWSGGLSLIDPIPFVSPVWLGNHNGGGAAGTGVANVGIYDGFNTVAGRVMPNVPFQQSDERQSPYFRLEWMQRMLNLTTERTHQYAVWITVGFFEVTQPGNPALAQTNPSAAYDRLGLELGSLEGSSIRYRGFFIVDRTRATGFSPTNPGDFQKLVLYRKLIE